MRCTTLAPTEIPQRASWSFWLRASPTTILNALRRHRRQASTIKTLRELDDRTLKDIGLHRSEIETVLAGIDQCRKPSRIA